MGFDASQALKFSTDYTIAIPSILGVAEYPVYLVNITNGIVSHNDVGASRVRTDTRILVADGYRAYAAQDGYLNPVVKVIPKVENQTIILAGASLTGLEVMLGPLVFPYSLPLTGQSGGFDPSLFQPGNNSNNLNTQIYVHIFGLGLNKAVGNYFKVSEIVLQGMSNICYKVRLTGIEDVIV